MLLIIPGCAQRVPITGEFNTLKETTKKITDVDISYNKNVVYSDEIEEILSSGLSRDKAVSIALQHNPKLQAAFEKLGISKADLMQAGLFTNPHSSNVFRIPVKGEPRQNNIESITTMALTDFWQVPLREKIYADELEITTLHILTLLLDTIEHTKNAYDACVHATLQLENAEIILTYTKDLQNQTYYRQPFGYSADIDLYNIDAQVATAQTAYEHRVQEQQTALLRLRELLGIPPTIASITFTNTILTDITTPSVEVMQSYALDARPEIVAARLKIRRYEDTIHFEKSRRFQRIDFGIGFKQDFEKPFQGWGPAVNIDLPIFDTNYAQIAKAEFEMARAQKELREQCILVQRQVQTAFATVKKTQAQAHLYAQQIIPAREQAIDYAYIYAETMQLNMITAFNTQLALYKSEEALIDTYYALHIAHNNLERAYGMKLVKSDLHG